MSWRSFAIAFAIIGAAPIEQRELLARRIDALVAEWLAEEAQAETETAPGAAGEPAAQPPPC